MRLKSLYPLVLLALIGALSVFAFSPLEIPGLMFVALAALFWAIHTADSPRSAALRGFVFGLGYFIANVHWVYISMHNYGGMPAWMAAGCVLLFAMFLALFPALAGWLSRRLPCRESLRLPLLIPTLFIATEWIRGWLFTGFAWAESGSSQLQLLHGWYPLIGSYGVGLLTALITGVALWRWRTGLVVFAVVLLGGWLLDHIEWSKPVSSVSVSLVQGGIPQNERWDMRLYEQALVRYLTLVRHSRGQLVLLPEAAIPSLLSDTPADYLQLLQQSVASRGAHLVSGFVTGTNSQYYNSVITLTGKPQTYSKQHLVPFGEDIPLPWLFGWMYRYLDMPLSGFARGGQDQVPLVLGNTLLAANVCYEDIFGNELRRGAREATLLANVSNMAWFDGSWAAEQHLQMSRIRAVENSRWMIRATNTGATAIIDHKGKIIGRLQAGRAGLLEDQVENREGLTPYTRWGDNPALLALGLLLLGLVGPALRHHQPSTGKPVV